MIDFESSGGKITDPVDSPIEKTLSSLDSRIRIGFIGFGKVGQLRHQILSERENVNLVGFVDPGVESSRGSLRKFHSVEELVNPAQLDAVFISTPNVFTAEYVNLALSQGISVFAEKPPALDMSDLLQTQRLLEKPNAPTLSYGFNHRHKQSVRKLLEIIHSGELGAVLWMRGRYGKEIDEEFFRNWRSDYHLAGGGILMDQGIHMLDIMLTIAGDFDEVYSTISDTVSGVRGIEDNVFAIYRSSKTGISASLHSTMTQWRYIFALEIFCEKGSVVINGLRTPSGKYGEETLTVHRRLGSAPEEQEDEVIGILDDDSWAREISLFLHAVIRKSQPELGTIEDAMRTLSIINRTYEADGKFSPKRNPRRA